MTSEDAERSEAGEGSSVDQNGDAPSQNGDSPEDLLSIGGHEDRTPPGEEADFVDDGAAEHAHPDEFYGEGDVEDVLPDEDDEGSAADEEPSEDGELDAVLPDEDVVGDSDDDEVEPVELLVQLAKKGEIDPWDIDIMRVTDRFLDALESVDLRTSGRALFYASVLLRMKSDALLEPEEEEPEEEWDPGDPLRMDADLPGGDPIDALEAEMDRRLERKSARGTPETLDELIRELRERERGSWWKSSRTYDTSDSPKGFRRGVQTLDYRADDATRSEYEPTEAEVTGTAHGEDIEATIEDVRAALDEQYAAGRAEVLFREVADAGGTRIETFLALLFLANRGAITLDQDEVFGDLWVQDATADDTVDEAVAD